MIISEIVNEHQKFKFANELITEIRRKTFGNENAITILAGGYPETHVESKSSIEDLYNLKHKIECGVDIVLTQVVFSASKFVEFVNNCNEIGISSDVIIIPGLYIPSNWKELKLVLRITKISMGQETYEKFKELKDDDQKFKEFSLAFMTELIQEIQQTSSVFIKGFHFFSMNNLEMIKKLVEIINFSGE